MARNESTVDIRGIDEVEAGRDKLVQDPKRARLIERPPEYVAAEYQGSGVEVGVA